jgi:ABC-2 type transport system permease protein
MNKSLEVIRWEFWTHFRSRVFLFSTLFSPLLLSFIILLPTLFLQEQNENVKIVGVVNFSDIPVQNLLARELNEKFRLENGSPKYFLLPIRIDESGEYGKYKRRLAGFGKIRDSLQAEYQKIKAKREKIFLRRPSAKRTKLLKSTYYELTYIREKRDISEIDYNNFLATVDSVYREQTLKTADERLASQQIDAYLVIPRDIINGSYGEYHARIIGDENEIEDIRRSLEEIIINQRMEADRISPSLRAKWLKPLTLEKVQISEGKKREFNYYINYFGPIIIVFMLFIAIFTSSGFLFTGILQEKSNRIIEILISSVTSNQLMAGKIIGLGTLGLVQVFFWIFISSMMVLFGAFDTEKMLFISSDNAMLFIIYFILGYFFYAAVYVAVASLFKSEKEAQQINSFLRIVAIFPVLMAILVLNDPQSGLVRFLSYIPFLTPTFMILRVSLFMPASTEIIASILIMVVSIFLMIRLAGKIFRIGILWEGNFPGWSALKRMLAGSGEELTPPPPGIREETEYTEGD